MSADDETPDIAIIGLACRFPGARDYSEFWRNLAAGVESIARLTDDEMLAAGVPAAHLAAPNYVKAAPVLDEPGGFDAAFFGIAPQEARTMDPQHRLLLELAHTALEDAACDPHRTPGRIGVFAGAAMNTYFAHAGLQRDFAEDYIPTLIGNDKDFLSTRVSYKLNLKGPSVTLQTACSTSLVAVHFARQSLLTGECDVALAGAVSVRAPHRAGYFADGGGIASPDGRVRAFDAAANGTVFGSGGGVVVLKRLRDALTDGDTIRAIIRGSALNNDGAEKAGYTAPSVNSQADAVIEALANADADAESISYLEAHGSGTPVGDPIEVRALTKAFRASTARTAFCALGSVKTNIGHLDAAAGMAGLIKTVLALEHRQIPASLHFTQPNPEIDFAATPFFVNTRLTPWLSPDGPRRAGIMSTGMGGTNAHLVLEEAPSLAAADVEAALSREAGRVACGLEKPRLFVLSAKTAPALAASTENLRAFLSTANADVNLDDAAFTLATGRAARAHRRFAVATHRDELLARLGEPFSRMNSGVATDAAPVVLLFPGVGDHYVGMGRELDVVGQASSLSPRASSPTTHMHKAQFPAFRAALDECAKILRPLGIELRDLLYPRDRDWTRPAAGGLDLKRMLAGNSAPAGDADARRLNEARNVQPALFAVEYALAKLWEDCGVRPAAIVGHSMGEYVAACLAGVFSLENALRLIVVRTQLVDRLPPAKMLAVTLAEEELRSLLPADVSIALINGPALCVVAGPVAVIEEFARTLEARQVTTRSVQNTHAFHSRVLDPIVEEFAREVARVPRHAPRVPFISNVTGRWITAAEAVDPQYWARHANHTAQFHRALETLWQMENPLLLEAGPGRTLGVLATQHPARPAALFPNAVASLRQHYEHHRDDAFFLQAVGRVWSAGHDIRWTALPSGASRRKIPLPTYPFEHPDFWLAPAAPSPRSPAEEPTLRPLDHWFHTPSWERVAPAGPASLRCRGGSVLRQQNVPPKAGNTGGTSAARTEPPLHGISEPGTRWLVFADARGDDHGFGAALANGGAEVEVVRFGDGIDPRAPEDYVRLLRRIREARPTAVHVIHLGGVTAAAEGDVAAAPSPQEVRAAPPPPQRSHREDATGTISATDISFFSLLHLAQAVGELDVSVPVKIAFISRGLHEVVGDESLDPTMAAALGPCGVLPKEFPNITCANIDLATAPDEDARRRILSEFARLAPGDVLALRGCHLWRRKFVPVSLPQPKASEPRGAALGSDRLRERGVYLITGGTGGIGLAVARHLATSCRARLVLTKKSPFPEKARWSELRERADTPPATARLLGQLLEIENLGGEVEVLPADASDRQTMFSVFSTTREKFGALHGVIHAAGIVRPGLAQTRTRKLVEQVFAPKIGGAQVLHELLAGAELDFLVLLSSITAVTTPFAESDYSGANAFLDAFAHFAAAQRPYPVISINWPGWKEAGQLVELKSAPGTEAWKESALKKAILTRDGVEAFARVLASGLPQIVVSPTDLDREIRESAPLIEPPRASAAAALKTAATSPVPTRPDEIEKCVTAVWQQIAGFERVGPEDSFFELGGHSLLLIQVHRELRRRLARDLSLVTLFQNPTPRALAQYLTTATAAPAVDKARQRAERQRQAIAARNLHR